MPQPDLSSDPAVVHFIAVATDFCRLLELKRRRSKRRLIEQVLKSTLALYSAGMKLPDVRPESGFLALGEWFEKHKHIPLEERIKRDPRVREHAKLHRSILGTVVGLLGDEYRYLKVFEPFEPKEGNLVFCLGRSGGHLL